MNRRSIKDYEDIINLKNPDPKNRPRMSMEDRAAQFAPFAALSGHKETIGETARETEKKRELAEDEKEALDRKLQILRHSNGATREGEIVYFVHDEKKEGGHYERAKGRILKIDDFAHKILLEDKTVIPIEEISDIIID